MCLAVEGKTTLSICLPADANPVVRYAAYELGRYLREITGADFPIRSAALEHNSIWLGIADRVPSEGSFARIATTSETCIIAPKPFGVTIGGSTPGATLQAVYRLLHSLGCRFLSPEFGFYDGNAESVPHSPTLICDISPEETSPRFKFRKLYVEEGHSHTTDSLLRMVEWMPKVGYNTLVVPLNYAGHDRVMWDNWRDALTSQLKLRGLTIEVGGHGYENFLNASMENGTLFDRHPEWFAADSSGTRHREQARVFCTSNRAAVDYLTSNVVAYLHRHPEIDIFDFWPPDSSRWCECTSCSASGTPSDRQALLLAHVKKALAQLRPGLRLETIAYASTVDPPSSLSLDKEILLDFCPISQQFQYQIDNPASRQNAQYLQALRNWRTCFHGDISIYSYYRKYAWDSLPCVLPAYMRNDLKCYAALPAQGVSTYAEPDDWGTYELNHYALAQLAWDPELDPGSITLEFCSARYGSSRDTALNALATLEKYVRTHAALPHNDPMTTQQLTSALAETSKVLADVGRVPAHDPLSRLHLMCEYARRDFQIQLMMQSDVPTATVREAIADLHAFLSANRDAGVFLLRDQRLSLNSLLKRYGLAEKKDKALTTSVRPQ